MRQLLMPLILTLLAPSIVFGVCAPDKMVRIVFRDATPGITPDSFASKPKTLYRLGSKYSRLEEALDSEHGIHGLAIAAEPDLWMINLAAQSGQHILDRSEPYVIHAQVFGGPTDPEPLKSFEFGCELAYITAKGTKLDSSTVGRFDLDNFKITEGPNTIFLAILSGTQRPLSASLFKEGQLVRMYQYVQYDRDLAPDLHLFKPPSGITIRESAR